MNPKSIYQNHCAGFVTEYSRQPPQLLSLQQAQTLRHCSGCWSLNSTPPEFPIPCLRPQGEFQQIPVISSVSLNPRVLPQDREISGTLPTPAVRKRWRRIQTPDRPAQNLKSSGPIRSEALSSQDPELGQGTSAFRHLHGSGKCRPHANTSSWITKPTQRSQTLVGQKFKPQQEVSSDRSLTPSPPLLSLSAGTPG